MAASDELRFGTERILNLREGLPTAQQAVDRAERWLREQQVRGSREVLVITGRGNQSIGGMPILRPAVEKLLFSLRRRGVVARHADHNPGAFVVQLASLRALTEAPPRRRERAMKSVQSTNIHGLQSETVQLLRDLSERSLGALGVVPDERTLSDEMQRHLSTIVSVLKASPDMEEELNEALRRAIAEYD